MFIADKYTLNAKRRPLFKDKTSQTQTSIAFLLSAPYIMFYQIRINCLSFQCLIGNVYFLFLKCAKEIGFSERNRLGKQKLLHYFRQIITSTGTNHRKALLASKFGENMTFKP